MDLDSFEKYLEKMTSVHGIETMLKVTNIIVKIIQEIITEPDNPKYKRIRVAAQVMMYQGAKELLLLFGFRLDQVGHYVQFQDEFHAHIKPWRDRLIEYRKSRGFLEGWELPHKMISFSDMLGKGRFGEVYQGQFEERPVAIKTIRPDASSLEKEDFRREAEIMSKVSHNNVLKLVGIAFNMEPMLIVLELMNGSISELLQQANLSNKEVLDRVVQVAAGMEHLHYKDIIHCDLAARNILLDDVGNLKISDFGLSRYAGTSDCNVKGQALPFPIRWTSPEVLVSLLLDKPADIWSFGILFFEFCTNGSVPYGDLSNMQTKSKVLSGYRLPRPAGCSEEMYGVMTKCWQSEPVQRPNFKSILETLLPLSLLMARQEKESIGGRQSISEKGGRPSKVSTASEVVGKRAQDYKVIESSLSNVLSKGGGLIRVYTANLSEFDSRVVIACKPRYTVTDVIVLSLIKSGTGNSDPNMYLLAEVVQNIMVPGPKQFSIHVLGKEDHPYGISLRWSSQDKGMFYLVHKTAKDNLNEIVNNGSAKHGRTAGYLVKFDENVSGHKQKARDTSLWHRIWCVLDGSTLLCYRSEEEEMLTTTASDSYINVAYHKKIEEAEAKKRNHVFRVITKTDDKYLIQANTQDDMNRWIEAIQYNLTESPSKVIQAMGEGEVKKTGYFEVNIPSHDLAYGKQWAVLKTTGLMQFFLKAEPKVIGFLQECNELEMHNPTPSNPSFFIEAVSNRKTYHLVSLTKEDHFEWGDIIHETLQELGASDKLKGYSQISQNQGAYIYIKRKLSTKNPVGGGGGKRNPKKSSNESICLPAVIQETSDNYGDFQHEYGMKAMQEQHITANESMKRLIQKNSHPYPPHIENIKNSESGESFQSTNSTSSLNENMLPSSSSSSSSGLADPSYHSKYQSSFQSLPVHMHNQIAEETNENRTFTPPPTADSPPPPPFPNLTGFTFQDLILIQQGDLPPPPDMATMRKKEKRSSIYHKSSNTDSSPDKTPDERGFTFSQEIRLKADRTSKNLEPVGETPEDESNSLESLLQSALKKKRGGRTSAYSKAVDTNDLDLSHEQPRTRLGSEPNVKKPFGRCNTLNDLDEMVDQKNNNPAISEDSPTVDLEEKRKSRDENASIRSAKPFSEKKALIANLFKKDDLPLQKAPRPKVQVSSKMEERQKMIKESMPDFNATESPDGDSNVKSQKIAKMLEQQRQIQIMAAESRPTPKIQSRPRSQTEFSPQKSTPDTSKHSHYSPRDPPMSPLTKQTFPTSITTTTTTTTTPQAIVSSPQQIPTDVVLPPGWKSREENMAMYYFNTLLGVSTWFYDDVVYLYEKSLETPGDSWVGYNTEENTRFFYQPSTGKRTWNIEETRKSPAANP